MSFTRGHALEQLLASSDLLLRPQTPDVSASNDVTIREVSDTPHAH